MAIEENSRAESGDRQSQYPNETALSIVKQEDNQDESHWMLSPTDSSYFLPNINTMEMNQIVAQTFEVPQDYVGENDFTEDVKHLEGRRRRRSEVWKDFTEEKKPDGSSGARCKRCNLLLSANSNSGTSHLNRHVKLYCPRTRYRDVKQVLRSASFKEKGRDNKGIKFSQDVNRKNLAKLVICAELPFGIVEQPAFVNFVKSLQPSVHFGAKETVRNDCIALYEEEKGKIHNMLKNLNSRVSFTLDVWTSEQNIPYMVFTAHFIDDNFVLKKKILNFKKITYPQTSRVINDEIGKCIGGWELDEKVLVLTFDDPAINDTLVMKFRATWSEKLVANGSYLHVRCCAKDLNTMVEDGMKVLDLAIERIRNIIKHVTADSSRMKVLNENAQQCGLATTDGLILDVSSKPNATYDMLQNALSYKDAFIRYTQLHYHGTDAPTNDDWEKTEIIMKFLKAFVNAINVFSRMKCPTVNLYLREIWTIRHFLYNELPNCDEEIRHFILEAQEKFKKYWDQYNMMLAIASILDPRFKFLFIQYCYENALGEEQAKQKVDEIRDCLYKLYTDYESAPQAMEHATSEESSGKGLSGLSEGSSSLELTYKRKLELEFATYLSQNGLKTNRSELDAYLDRDVLLNIDDEDFNILSWWKMNAELYPVLSRMARDVLAIPVSAVASKSAFSSCSRLMHQSGSFTDPSLIESFICTQDWFHDGYDADVTGICNVLVTEFPDIHASNEVDEEILESCLAK